jgi:hypothetical protein
MNVNKHGAMWCSAPKNKDHTNYTNKEKWQQVKQYLTPKYWIFSPFHVAPNFPFEIDESQDLMLMMVSYIFILSMT